jgi:hypothetical protein
MAHSGPLCERHSLLWPVVTSSEASAFRQCVCAPGSEKNPGLNGSRGRGQLSEISITTR